MQLSPSGQMTDNDGNQYATVTIDGMEWMAENYRGGDPWYMGYYVSNGFEYGLDVDDEDAEDDIISRDGNLYTYAEAVANTPEGWRLPTDDDWKRLEVALGMSQSEAGRTGWRNGAGRNMASPTGMRMAYNGQLCYFSYSVKLYHRGAYGNYWSATPDEDTAVETVYTRTITPSQDRVERAACSTENRWMSVRYVRDV